MGRLNHMQKRLKEQDPNNIYKVSARTKCTTVNDYINWNELSGEVITYKLNKEELKKYLKGV